ncbi:MAG: hypothetical protein ACRYG8_00205, partial [Janthinobacterium lividum]
MPRRQRREIRLDVSPDLLHRQVAVLGSWTFSTVGQAECARFVAERGIDVDALFTDHFALEDAGTAYRAFDQRQGRVPALRPAAAQPLAPRGRRAGPAGRGAGGAAGSFQDAAAS